jgi:hypothetical protein
MKYILTLLFGATLLAFPSLLFAETVMSDNFVLRDASGRTTAQLTTSGDGTPAFFIYDSKGVVRVSIGLYPDGAPGVVLNDSKGLAGAIMRLVENNGEPVVVLKENGQDRYIIKKDGPDAGTTPITSPFMTVLATALISIIGSSLMTLYILGKRLPPSLPLPPQSI